MDGMVEKRTFFSNCQGDKDMSFSFVEEGDYFYWFYARVI